jgi:Putative beta-lactamase-inhibitor-like, PepSY-like
MKLHRHKLAASALLAIVVGATSALADEQKVSCRAVPAPVRTAFEKAFPKASIKHCAREVEKGKTAYEIASVEGETGRDVTFHPDGTVISVEETISFGSVPEPVQRAVKERYPGGELARAEKIIRGDTVLYEFGIKHGNKSVEIVFDPGGNEVKP